MTATRGGPGLPRRKTRDPRTHRPTPAQPAPPNIATLTHSFFNIPLPASWRRSSKKTEAEETPAAAPVATDADAAAAAERAHATATATPAGAAPTETTDGKGLFDEVVEAQERKKRTKKWTEVSLSRGLDRPPRAERKTQSGR